jgi:predicted O-methyltransferase YrrM
MKTKSIKEYFQSVDYDYQKDKDALEDILKLTKTRVNPNMKSFEFSYGMEQTFFLKAVAEAIGAKNFFEIGTGRGTASYAVSLISAIEKIVTVDIVPHNQKKNEAVNYKPALVSNSDLYDLIKFKEKEKIHFKHVDDYLDITEEYSSFFDVCFIDGNHDIESIILNDFNICMKVLKKPGYIIWDDYDPNKFQVKKVVDDICSKYQYECELVEFRGHLFGENPPEKNAGEVIMKIL